MQFLVIGLQQGDNTRVARLICFLGPSLGTCHETSDYLIWYPYRDWGNLIKLNSLSLSPRVCRGKMTSQNFHTFSKVLKIKVIIAIIEFSLKNTFRWVQSSLVFVKCFLRYPFFSFTFLRYPLVFRKQFQISEKFSWKFDQHLKHYCLGLC